MQIGWQHVQGDVLAPRQSKTGATAYVPMTAERRASLKHATGRMAFLLTAYGKPFSAAGLGNAFRDAAPSAGVEKSLQGLRKAFCIYWAEAGKSVRRIAAMSGHARLEELEPYTRAADRLRMVRALSDGEKCRQP